MNLQTPLKAVLRTTGAHLKKLTAMGVDTIFDLLEYFPRKVESANITTSSVEIQIGVKNTIAGRLTNIQKQRTQRGKTLVKGVLSLDDGTILPVIWFRAPYSLKGMRDGQRVFLVGKVDQSYGKLQLMNPEVHLDAGVHVGGIRAIYPESPPITSKWMREKLAPLLPYVKEWKDFLPTEIQAKEELLSKSEAMLQIHKPATLEQWGEAKRRLAFEEIFEIQVRVIQSKLLREKYAKSRYIIPFDAETVKADLEKLPFELTFAQRKVLWHILQDMEKDKPAHRLVQGDVGAGKTIVAFLAALQVIRAGHQVVILAPTEILAKQHFQKAIQYFTGFRVELLTGSVTAKKKESIKSQLANKDIDVLIGTHAVLTEDTEFHSLALAIIDEQHRFGVKQRQILADAGAHVVAMTATPIPRTLALTVYGDQDLSIIDELPAGRKPIITRVLADPKKKLEAQRFIDDQIQKGNQVFWVCPLVEESETLQVKNVKEHHVHVAEDLFPNRKVEMLHGKMKAKEKDSVMERFRKKEFDILVSTSVIEVGVDIPDATVMVIENSERFGLSQLHQFRGRIGRNDKQSYCFLMVDDTENARKARLQAMEQTGNGFHLAEIDLKLRGAGEIYGVKQSGIPDLKCADLTDTVMMSKAREWAQKILEEDLTLETYPMLRDRIMRERVYV